MPKKRTPSSLMLACGRYFDPCRPDPVDVDMPSVALGLERVVRFNGQTTRPITVAEHCKRVAQIASDLVRSGMGEDLVRSGMGEGGPFGSSANSPDLVLGRKVFLLGLLHDAEEGIVGDIPSPIKTDDQRRMGDRVRRAIFEHLEVTLWVCDPKVEAIVKRADRIALVYEALAWQQGASDWAQYARGDRPRSGSLDPLSLPRGSWLSNVTATIADLRRRFAS